MGRLAGLPGLTPVLLEGAQGLAGYRQGLGLAPAGLDLAQAGDQGLGLGPAAGQGLGLGAERLPGGEVGGELGPLGLVLLPAAGEDRVAGGTEAGPEPILVALACGHAGVPVALETLGLLAGALEVRLRGQGLDLCDEVVLEFEVSGALFLQVGVEAVHGGAEALLQGPAPARIDRSLGGPGLAGLALGADGLLPVHPGPIDLVEKGLQIQADLLALGGIGLLNRGPVPRNRAGNARRPAPRRRGSAPRGHG